MSASVHWNIYPEARRSFVTPSQALQLPTATMYLDGSFYVGNAGDKDTTDGVMLSVFKAPLEYEAAVRTTVSGAKQGKSVSEMLGFQGTVNVRAEGRNEVFYLKVEALRTTHHLLDVTGLKVYDDGSIAGAGQFKTTQVTTKFGIPELPFVSKDVQTYLLAMDLYAGVGSYPELRTKVIQQARNKSRQVVSTIGYDFFGGHHPVIEKPVSKRLTKRGPPLVLAEIIDGFKSRRAAPSTSLEKLRAHFMGKVPRIPDEYIVQLRRENYAHQSNEEIDKAWNDYFIQNVAVYFAVHSEEEGLRTIYQGFRARERSVVPETILAEFRKEEQRRGGGSRDDFASSSAPQGPSFNTFSQEIGSQGSQFQPPQQFQPPRTFVPPAPSNIGQNIQTNTSFSQYSDELE